jgi:6-phosphogluconolactonase
MKVAPFLSFLALGTLAAFAAPEPFYLGTYTGHTSARGIYEGTLDSVRGKLGPLTLVAPESDPSFLAVRADRKILCAIEEKNPGIGSVESFRRAGDGSLTSINEQPAAGAGTCHVAIDPSGRDVLVANYGSGNIACFPLGPDGTIGARTAFEQFTGSGPNANRQKGPHAHSIYVSPDDAFVYSCDLGSDQVWIFKFDAARGTLTPSQPPSTKVPPGAGPRHLAFSRDGAMVYVANEMGNSVTVMTRNPSTGALTPVQTISTLTPGAPTANITTAEIALHPSGKWLYVSNRGPDTITQFAVEPNRRLKFVQSVSAGVKWPRSFAIDPSGHWIISAGQYDNRIAVLKIDSRTGKLSTINEAAQVGSPVCVLFENRLSP